jgi:hypothetical protein
LAAIDAHEAREFLHRLGDQGFLGQHAAWRRQLPAQRYAAPTGRPAPHSTRTFRGDPPPRHAGTITNSDVRAATGLDRAEARAFLDRLVKEGRLTRGGQRRGVKYRLAARR